MAEASGEDQERILQNGFSGEHGLPGFIDVLDPVLHGDGSDGYGGATHDITCGVCGACEGRPLVCFQRLSRIALQLHRAPRSRHQQA